MSKIIAIKRSKTDLISMCRQKRGLARRYIVVLLMVLAIAVVGLLPSAASNKWVYSTLLKQVSMQGFDLDVDSITLRWFSPLRIDGLRLREAKQETALLQIDSISTDQGLLSYLLSGFKAARIEIQSPKLDIEWIDNDVNLRRLVAAIEGRIGKPGEEPVTVSAKPLDLRLIVKDLEVFLRSDQVTTSVAILNKINLDGTYKRDAKGAYVHLEPAKLLDHTELTPELMRLGLEYAIPVLAKSAWFQGRVSLETGALDIPIDRPLDSSGTAVITLHEAKSGPTEPEMKQLLDILARIRGKESVYELVFIDNSKIELEMLNQQITHRGLQFGFPKIDPRLQFSSQGRVSLGTRGLDLLVQVPVPLEQLARREKVRELGVPTIGIPVRGTLDKPEVDLAAMRGDSADLIGLVRQQIESDAPAASAALGALEGLASGEADAAITATVDLLREFQKRRQANREKDDAPGATEETPSQTPIRDALKNIFRREPE